MTPEEFAVVYAQARPRAVELAGEDAVQDAAEYVLKRLERETLPLRQGAPLERVTVSWFIQLCVSRARDAHDKLLVREHLNLPLLEELH